MEVTTQQVFEYSIFGIGLSGYDLSLLILCPIFAMLGTLVANSVKGILEKPEFEPLTELPPHYLRRLRDSGDKDEPELALAELNSQMKHWHATRVRRSELLDFFRLPFIGLVLGLVIALYFVGAITNDVTSLTRVLGLCVLLGYQAPNIWLTQEKAIKKALDKKIESVLNKSGLTSGSTGRS